MERRSFVAVVAALAAWTRGLPGAVGEEVVVFAAASLADALREIAAGFEARTGHRVVLSLGGSNDLARQIRAGAAARVFVSASAERISARSGPAGALPSSSTHRLRMPSRASARTRDLRT